MRHTIPLEKLKDEIGPQVEWMAGAIEACVHCGFCLPACPTYQVLGQEIEFATRPDFSDEVRFGRRAAPGRCAAFR